MGYKSNQISSNDRSYQGPWDISILQSKQGISLYYFYLSILIRCILSDVGSVASTIMYAFHVDETIKSKHFFTVPVINMKRADLDTHVNVRWLLNSCHIDLSSLIFIDEVLIISVFQT